MSKNTVCVHTASVIAVKVILDEEQCKNEFKKIFDKKFKISRRRVRSSFQYEGPQVPQVTYREGREGNVFISECLCCLVCEEHAKTNF